MKNFKELMSSLTSVALLAVVIPSGQIVPVPQVAVDHSPALESITFIHYRDGAVKPENSNKPRTSTCYSFISKGAKLVSPENLLVNPINSGMPEPDVLGQTIASESEWDNNTSANLFGSSSLNYSANFDSVADNLNEISFGSYDDPNVIAVTRIWGIFSGAPSTKRIDQFDILFNTAYSWGDALSSTSTVMDYRNIATHEIGHGVGLSDLYNNCVNETMYGYSSYGETSKRDLNIGDIQGLSKLYGI